MNDKNIFMSIVIPVYNEEKRIEGFLSNVISFIQQKSFLYEILIVDDGSTDGTINVVDNMLRQNIKNNYRILKLPINRGKGEAVRQGMLKACGEYIFFVDADGSTSIHEIDTFVPYFKNDIAVYIAVRTKKHEAPMKRKFFGYGYIFLANIFLQTHVSDFTCGFKCYRRDAAQRIFNRQTLANWSFDAEDLFIARKYRYAIKEIPVFWKHYGGSKVKVFRNVIECGLDLLKIRWNDILGKYNSQ